MQTFVFTPPKAAVEERDDRLGPSREKRERQRALKALERLGYAVTLDKVG